jgi:hypothetical protein
MGIMGNPVMWPKAGEQATTFDEYGAPGPPYACCGHKCEDLTGLFSKEEVSSLAQLMECVQAGDSLEHNMFEPDPTEPGPDGALCHTIHHKFNSAYSSEKKVNRAEDDRMEEDDPPPPPPPNGDPSRDSAGKPPPPANTAGDPPPPPPPAPSSPSTLATSPRRRRRPARRTSSRSRAAGGAMGGACLARVWCAHFSVPLACWV